MKKILAIALAVVMVLSMTAAFAWSWTCPSTTAKTGKATLEVIPYVKVNNGCGGYDWVQSNCAAAVQTENVYFIVKLTVAKDINPIWWKHLSNVKLTFTKGGFNTAAKTASTADAVYEAKTPYALASGLPKDDSSDGWVFYMDPAQVIAAQPYVVNGATDKTGATVWTKDATDEATLTATDYMFGMSVADARKAKVCAKFTSDFDGFGEWLIFGDYKVLVTKATAASVTTLTMNIIESCVTTPAVVATDATAPAAGASVLVLTTDATGKIWTAGAAGQTSCSGAFANAALNYFGIQLGTCLNEDNVRANFGWKDKVESCFTWSGNATAIVDVQCEVEIPKTGDVSVIAYAVMAVVAAAGAMGLKK